MPDSQKLERSTQALGGMRESLRQVFEKVEEARRTKDVVKLNCANEKLTQIKGLLRISEQADVALQEALTRRETSVSEHEFTKVMIARQKVSVDPCTPSSGNGMRAGSGSRPTHSIDVDAVHDRSS